jgi:hypothetical protein
MECRSRNSEIFAFPPSLLSLLACAGNPQLLGTTRLWAPRSTNGGRLAPRNCSSRSFRMPGRNLPRAHACACPSIIWQISMGAWAGGQALERAPVAARKNPEEMHSMGNDESVTTHHHLTRGEGPSRGSAKCSACARTFQGEFTTFRSKTCRGISSRTTGTPTIP